MTETVLLVGAVVAQGLSLGAMRASDGLRRAAWVVVAFAAMGASVLLMARALDAGMSLAVGYGVWSGAGIGLAAATGSLVFGDRLARVHVAGLALVLGGVVLVYGG
ncbi:MAG TPA: SMR family transporter [Actinomycetospora sp.]|nr:SMR family transporter [Actinomycetospora sp.]